MDKLPVAIVIPRIGDQSGNTPIVPPDGERIAALRDYMWQAVLAVIGNQ